MVVTLLGQAARCAICNCKSVDSFRVDVTEEDYEISMFCHGDVETISIPKPIFKSAIQGKIKFLVPLFFLSPNHRAMENWN